MTFSPGASRLAHTRGIMLQGYRSVHVYNDSFARVARLFLQKSSVGVKNFCTLNMLYEIWRTFPATCVLCIHMKGLLRTSRAYNMSRS